MTGPSKLIEDTVAHNAGRITMQDEHLIQRIERYRDTLDRGQQPDRRKLLADYPMLKGELAACLDALEFIHLVAPQLQPPDDSAHASETLESVSALGDFRIEREIGRGGMGVVYKARQMSLRRTVALKVLPFAAMLDTRQLKRFKNEALAAATLEHPHIVPVYSIDSQRGVYFYAMRLIQGQTLAQLIARLRQDATGDGKGELTVTGHWIAGEYSAGMDESFTEPAFGDSTPVSGAPIGIGRDDEDEQAVDETTRRDAQAALSTERSAAGSGAYFRSVARIGIEAAGALHHAHTQGIIHRDIKPGNLMIDTDDHLWVTDFGLARIVADPPMTMTGELLGTLRYMAPEQALGKRVTVDHRVDIYSLGVTLYELLTLRPAFDEDDRQELLNQIALREPVRPRRIAPSVPRDLETIILKSMAKNPDERYVSAQDLADDLQRYLDDEPIVAHPITRLHRAWRWCRRRPRDAALVASIVVLIFGLVAVGFWYQQYRATQALEYVRLERDVLAAIDEAESEQRRIWTALTNHHNELLLFRPRSRRSSGPRRLPKTGSGVLTPKSSGGCTPSNRNLQLMNRITSSL